MAQEDDAKDDPEEEHNEARNVVEDAEEEHAEAASAMSSAEEEYLSWQKMAMTKWRQRTNLWRSSQQQKRKLLHY